MWGQRSQHNAAGKDGSRNGGGEKEGSMREWDDCTRWDGVMLTWPTCCHVWTTDGGDEEDVDDDDDCLGDHKRLDYDQREKACVVVGEEPFGLDDGATGTATAVAGGGDEDYDGADEYVPAAGDGMKLTSPPLPPTRGCWQWWRRDLMSSRKPFR